MGNKNVTFFMPIEQKRMSRINYFIHATFPYEVIDEQLINSPEEKISTQMGSINIGVKHHLIMCWKVKGVDLFKVMFEYAKRKVIQDLQNETFYEYQDLKLTPENTDNILQFEPDKIDLPDGHKSFIVNVISKDPKQ